MRVFNLLTIQFTLMWEWNFPIGYWNGVCISIGASGVPKIDVNKFLYNVHTVQCTVKSYNLIRIGIGCETIYGVDNNNNNQNNTQIAMVTYHLMTKYVKAMMWLYKHVLMRLHQLLPLLYYHHLELMLLVVSPLRCLNFGFVELLHWFIDSKK